MIRKGVLLFVLVAALAVPGVAAAGGADSYPAAGPVIVGSVKVRAKPTMTSKNLLLLRDYRNDGLTQYVLALKQKRVGYMPRKWAKLTLENTSGSGALVLKARAYGPKGNVLSATVEADPGSDPGLAQLVIRNGSIVLATITFSTSDMPGLAEAVNTMEPALPLTANAISSGPLALAPTTHLAGGKRGNAGKLWLRIVVPARPLNRRGWIPAYAARIKPTEKSIVVNRTTHWLQVFKGDRRIFKTRVATGRADRPTPAGLFYIAAKYRPPENGAVTAFALELSAPAGLPDFTLGGVVGIHGTPLLSTLGHSASNGCIRVSAAAVLRLKKIIPVGTPIRVTG